MPLKRRSIAWLSSPTESTCKSTTSLNKEGKLQSKEQREKAVREDIRFWVVPFLPFSPTPFPHWDIIPFPIWGFEERNGRLQGSELGTGSVGFGDLHYRWRPLQILHMERHLWRYLPSGREATGAFRVSPLFFMLLQRNKLMGFRFVFAGDTDKWAVSRATNRIRDQW